MTCCDIIKVGSVVLSGKYLSESLSIINRRLFYFIQSQEKKAGESAWKIRSDIIVNIFIIFQENILIFQNKTIVFTICYSRKKIMLM